MLFRWFRKGHYIQQISIWIGVAALFRLPAFFLQTTPSEPLDGLILQGVIKTVAGMPILSLSLVLLFTLLCALMLNVIMQSEDLVAKLSSVPAMVFVVFSSAMPQTATFSAAWPALFFMLVSLFYLFRSYRIEEPYLQLFNAGMFMSLAALFYSPLVYFLLFLFIALLVFRAFKWRDWVITFLGIITPLLYFITWKFWVDDLQAVGEFFISLFDIADVLLPATDLRERLFYALYLPATILAMVTLISHTNEMVISIRRMYWVLIWQFLITLSLLFISPDFQALMIITLIPVSAFTAHYFSTARRYRFSDVLITLWFIATFVMQFLV